MAGSMHCPRAVSDLRVGDQSTSARTHESAARPPFLCPTHFVPHFAFLGLALPLAHSPPPSPVSSSASLHPRRGLQCPNPARDGLFIAGVGRFAPTAASLIYFEARDTRVLRRLLCPLRLRRPGRVRRRDGPALAAGPRGTPWVEGAPGLQVVAVTEQRSRRAAVYAQPLSPASAPPPASPPRPSHRPPDDYLWTSKTPTTISLNSGYLSTSVRASYVELG